MAKQAKKKKEREIKKQSLHYREQTDGHRRGGGRQMGERDDTDEGGHLR